MAYSTSYTQLVTEHDRIEELADSILRQAASDQPDDGAIATTLSELAQLVAEHLEKEDELIYPKLAAASGNQKGARISDQLASLKQDWIAYLREWTPDCVAADHGGFSTETEAILGRLKTHVRLESDLLYASALQKGTISLR